MIISKGKWTSLNIHNSLHAISKHSINHFSILFLCSYEIVLNPYMHAFSKENCVQRLPSSWSNWKELSVYFDGTPTKKKNKNNNSTRIEAKTKRKNTSNKNKSCVMCMKHSNRIWTSITNAESWIPFTRAENIFEMLLMHSILKYDRFFVFHFDLFRELRFYIVLVFHCFFFLFFCS